VIDGNDRMITEPSMCLPPLVKQESGVLTSPQQNICLVPKVIQETEVITSMDSQNLILSSNVIEETANITDTSQNICMSSKSLDDKSVITSTQENICLVPKVVEETEVMTTTDHETICLPSKVLEEPTPQNICLPDESIDDKSMINSTQQNMCLLPKALQETEVVTGAAMCLPTEEAVISQPAATMCLITKPEHSNDATNSLQMVPKVLDKPVHFRKPPPEKFIHEGCMYNFISFSKNRRYKFWRCDKRSQGCKVRIHTDSRTNKIVKMRNIHNHDNDPKDVELKRLKAIVKVRALQTVENPAQVIKQSLLEVPNGPFELNAIQKRNLAKVINRERSLASLTLAASAPSIVEENQEVLSDDLIEDIDSPREQSMLEDNPDTIQKVLVEFGGELSDEDLNNSCDTPNLFINIDTGPPNAPYIKMELDNYYSPNEKKPKEKLIEGGCMYAFDRYSTDGRVKFWRCDHRAHGCAVRLHTDAVTDEVSDVINAIDHQLAIGM